METPNRKLINRNQKYETMKWDHKYETIENCIIETEWVQTKTVQQPRQEIIKQDNKQEAMKWDPKHETIENSIIKQNGTN